MTRFDFATATRIIFGAGALREIGPLAQQCGSRALVVTGRDPHRAEPLLAALRQHGVQPIASPVTGEPDLQTVEGGLALARQEGCQLVISLGGGSAIDAGKAVAAMLANEGELLDYLEVVGRGKALSRPSVPFIAIPTTAGTGSEVTRNAVLASPRHRVKVSLRGLGMLPRIALVDPELTHALAPALTASTGLDALTQLIEPYVCSRANPMTDALCVEGLRRAASSLRAAFENGRNAAAREDMAIASLFGGLALANAGLGAVHGFAGPIGGLFPAPHGAVCAALLPHVMEANLRALRQRQADGPTLRRYDEIARLLTHSPTAVASQGVEWVRRLVADLGIPSLAAHGLSAQHIPDLVDKAAKASSMKANPISLTPDELTGILRDAL
ncbi:MAG TPA: iron-containing alcohol dehydrogenase [Dongiaceae bacterium]|nr:iron-containing alcohol dehydrogenase [Dongiaceae bacterium]